mmetsp:Transcript_95826/g.200293  ORF Transcript_95826/g.200293 Transcript_95826/m.200293 type:complete len:212 (+) Transcript_95826:1119-1754(+)
MLLLLLPRTSCSVRSMAQARAVKKRRKTRGAHWGTMKASSAAHCLRARAAVAAAASGTETETKTGTGVEIAGRAGEGALHRHRRRRGSGPVRPRSMQAAVGQRWKGMGRASRASTSAEAPKKRGSRRRRRKTASAASPWQRRTSIPSCVPIAKLRSRSPERWTSCKTSYGTQTTSATRWMTNFGRSSDKRRIFFNKCKTWNGVWRRLARGC